MTINLKVVFLEEEDGRLHVHVFATEFALNLMSTICLINF